MKIRYIFYIILYVLAVISGVEVNARERGYVPEVGRVVKPDMVVVAEEDRGDYMCQLVEFSVDDSYFNERGRKVKSSERIKGYLLVPDAARKGKCPALVMLHDHGARFDIGKEKLARPIAGVLPYGKDDHIFRSSEQWSHKYFDGMHLADSLAALGYVVLVADALYWGERSSAEAQRWSELMYALPGKETREEDRSLVAKVRKDTLKLLHKRVYEGQRVVYDSLRRREVIWAEKVLRDDMASARLLADLPFVDRKRVGAFGFSMGAHRCWLLASFCKHIKYGIAVAWMTTLDTYNADNTSDVSMRIQPMRDYMDFGDIGMYLYPKPMLFLNGDSDHLFPQESIRVAFDKLHLHYNTLAGNPSKSALRTQFFSGGHHCGKSVLQSLMDFLQNLNCSL